MINDLRPRNSEITGTITKIDDEYIVSNGTQKFASCITYEQAYYVREEMDKNNWQWRKLPKILDNYPSYYTDLLDFYRYVTINKATEYKWCVSIPSKKSDNGVLQQVRCTNIEDALFERDFLVEHDWDYELLVYCIDDRKNPYYDVELPPYPQRKIKNISVANTHRKELTLLNELIFMLPNLSQQEVCRLLGYSDMTLRNWFHKYGTNWSEYREMVFDGINPLDVLTFEKQIYKPNLKLKNANVDYSKYVKHSRKHGNFTVMRNQMKYGEYPTREIAEQVVGELFKYGWDKKNLSKIKKSVL